MRNLKRKFGCLLLGFFFLLAGLPVLQADDFTTDFESGFLLGWTKTGTAFNFQPTFGDNPKARNNPYSSKHAGDWWIGGYEKYQKMPGQKPGGINGDGPKGTLVSAPFRITGSKISFLIGGGNHPLGDASGATAVALEVEGKTVRSSTGNNSESMVRKSWNVAQFNGKSARIKIIDENSGGWGHINCDDFQMTGADDKLRPFTAQMTVPAQMNMVSRVAPSGPDKSTTSTVFVDVPHMAAGIMTEAHSDLVITFSAEANTDSNKRMFLRALVDDEVAAPSDVVFAIGPFKGTRTFTFVKKNLGAGGHWVRLQWHTDSGGKAYLGDRSLNLTAASAITKNGRVLVQAAPSGPDKTTTSTAWVDLPGMTGNITTSMMSNLEVNFSGEVHAAGNSRMFLRALIDGAVARPADVLHAKGGFTGTRQFQFTRANLSPGKHTIKIQWAVDPSGKIIVGDRTLSAVAAPMVSKYGGLSTKTAPSSQDKTTSSTGWVDMPHMADSIATAVNSDLVVNFSGEVHGSGNSRVFIRALVDGQPAEPSDVVVAVGPHTGTRGFQFTKKRLGVGNHNIKLQWHSDSGHTAYVGDRSLSMHYWQRPVPDLSQSYHGIKPVIGSRNVLTILWDPHRPDHPAPTRSTIENLIYGPDPSVRGYFLENSGGRFKLNSVGILGWYDAKHSGDHYWGWADQEDLPEDRNKNGQLDPGEDLNGNGKLDGPDGILQADEDKNNNGKLDKDLDGDGWVSGHTEKWAEAIRKADVQFNYAKYDKDNNKHLSSDELVILIVIPQNSPFGTQRGVVGRQHPTATPLIVDGVQISSMVEAYIGAPPSIGLVAHELAHILFGAGDMYFYFFQPYAAGPYSLMDQAPHNPAHIDPFHKLRAGWLLPRRILSDGTYTLRDIESHNEVGVLYDPSRGDAEYYLVENRWRGQSYDKDGQLYSGLGVWHIMEKKSVYNNLPVPPKVNSPQWNDPKWQGWSRKGIRMVRPLYGPPMSWSLWDGADSATGYDLLSTDPNPDHATLKWADGKASGFSIKSIPTASAKMKTYIDVP